MKIILIFILLNDNISLCKKLLLISFTAGLPFYNSTFKEKHACICQDLYMYTVFIYCNRSK